MSCGGREEEMKMEREKGKKYRYGEGEKKVQRTALQGCSSSPSSRILLSSGMSRISGLIRSTLPTDSLDVCDFFPAQG